MFVLKLGGSVAAAIVRQLAKGMGINTNHEMADFKEWMEREKKVRFVGGRQRRSYEGMELTQLGAALASGGVDGGDRR